MHVSRAERRARPNAEPAQHPLRRPGPPAWPIALALAALALLPRCLGLADFFTIDEPYHWISRVQRFSEALGRGDWAATDLTGHPGVTTMWLGALGRRVGQLIGVRDLGGAGAGAAYLATLRMPLAVVNGLAVAAGYLALRRLLRPQVALLAGLLWATSPYLIGLGRLLHLDGLLTSFMTLSVLLLLVAVEQRTKNKEQNGNGRAEDRGWRMEDRQVAILHPPSSILYPLWPLVGSGFFAGLALLTKAPSLFLLPFAGLLLFVMTTDDRRPTTDHRQNRQETRDERQQTIDTRRFWDLLSPVSYLLSFVLRRLRVVLPIYLLWLMVAVLVVVALWPAMWVAPLAALGDVYNEILANGGAPEPAGNFFLGQAVAAPGWLFYPAVLLWRTTPWTLLGLALLPLMYFRFWILDFGLGQKIQNHTLLALLAFALLFGLMMSIEPKKYDRYLLPIWPALEILAAAGLVALVEYLQRYWRQTTKNKEQRTKGITQFVLCSLFFVLMAAPLAWYHPYYLAYFNPLLGGGATAQRVMLVGLGEGMDQVGAWLRARPDLKRGPVLSWIPPTLAPFVPAAPGVLDLRVQLLDLPSSYAVLYARSVQRQESAVAEAYVRQTPPLFTLRLYGIEYATIHQLPRPFDIALDAQFGEGLHLRGFSQRHEGQTLTITPSWDVQASQPGGRFCFVHVLGPDGQRVAQVDALLDQGMFPTWQAGQQFDTPFPLQLPTNLPPGQYRVVMGVYTPDGGRLPLRHGAPAPADLAGPDALLVATLDLP